MSASFSTRVQGDEPIRLLITRHDSVLSCQHEPLFGYRMYGQLGEVHGVRRVDPEVLVHWLDRLMRKTVATLGNGSAFKLGPDEWFVPLMALRGQGERVIVSASGVPIALADETLLAREVASCGRAFLEAAGMALPRRATNEPRLRRAIQELELRAIGTTQSEKVPRN